MGVVADWRVTPDGYFSPWSELPQARRTAEITEGAEPDPMNHEPDGDGLEEPTEGSRESGNSE